MKSSVSNHGSYLSARHDNWHYSKAALEIASKYDPETKKYIQHKYLEHTSEIMLSVPMLYISQSLLTGFSMTGYVPVPSGMTSRFINIYSDNIFPDFFLYDFQKLYYPGINFWYIHCFLLMIFALFFIEGTKEKNISNIVNAKNSVKIHLLNKVFLKKGIAIL